MNKAGTKLAKGICPTCDYEWAVIETIRPDEEGQPRVSRVMRNHNALALEFADRNTWKCLGGGKPPKEITQEAS